MTAPHRLRSSILNILKLLALAAPALFAGMLIYLYGVDVPYADQWKALCPIFVKMNDGTLQIHDFFAFHSEHRLFFPRLLMFGLAWITHWNIRVEMFAIWFLTFACLVNFWLAGRIGRFKEPYSGYWSLLIAAFLVFTPLQYENFLMGFQISFLLPVAAFTACLWTAPLIRFPFNFILTGLLCTVCTFTLASGFLTWLLCAPLLLFPAEKLAFRVRLACCSVMAGVFIIEMTLYFHGYVQPGYHPSVLEAFRQPSLAMRYFLAYLGAPFAFGMVFSPFLAAPWPGAFLVLLALFAFGYTLSQWRDSAFVAKALPWLALAFFAIANAALTTVGRVGFGVTQALVSRYVAFSIMLPIALAFLFPELLRHINRRDFTAEFKIAMDRCAAVAAAVLIALYIPGMVHSLVAWPAYQHTRLFSKAIVTFANIVDEPDYVGRYVDTPDPSFKEQANVLNRLGYLHPALIKTNFIREIGDPHSPGEIENGMLQRSGFAPSGDYGLAGWAILPEKGRPADAVVFTYDDANGEPVIYDLEEVSTARDDIAKLAGDSAFLKSGWSATFPLSLVPLGAQTLKAWAFDAEECRAYRIKGSATIRRDTL